MRPKELKPILIHAIKNQRQVLLVGAPGVGKSDIIDLAAHEAGANMIVKHPSIEDPTDAKGLPSVYVKDDGETGAKFLPYDDLVRLISADSLTVCHLEDFGQAQPATQSSYMQLLLRRQINGHKLSPHVVFIASTNDTKDMAGVGGLLEPIKSRFHTILKMEVGLDDWCEWALDHDMPAELIAFIRFRQELLHKFTATRELTNSPCPRNWHSVGKWLNTGLKNLEVFQGCVGEGAAAEFYAFLDLCAKLPAIDAILMDPDGEKVPDQPSAMFAVVCALAKKATAGNFDRVVRYIKRMPKEFEVCCVRDAVRLTKAITTCKPFIEWGIKNKGILSY